MSNLNRPALLRRFRESPPAAPTLRRASLARLSLDESFSEAERAVHSATVAVDELIAAAPEGDVISRALAVVSSSRRRFEEGLQRGLEARGLWQRGGCGSVEVHSEGVETAVSAALIGQLTLAFNPSMPQPSVAEAVQPLGVAQLLPSLALPGCTSATDDVCVDDSNVSGCDTTYLSLHSDACDSSQRAISLRDQETEMCTNNLIDKPTSCETLIDSNILLNDACISLHVPINNNKLSQGERFPPINVTQLRQHLPSAQVLSYVERPLASTDFLLLEDPNAVVERLRKRLAVIDDAYTSSQKFAVTEQPSTNALLTGPYSQSDGDSSPHLQSPLRKRLNETASNLLPARDFKSSASSKSEQICCEEHDSARRSITALRAKDAGGERDVLQQPNNQTNTLEPTHQPAPQQLQDPAPQEKSTATQHHPRPLSLQRLAASQPATSSLLTRLRTARLSTN